MTREDVSFVEPYADLLPGKRQWTWQSYEGRTRLVIGCPACGRTIHLETRHVDKYGVYRQGRPFWCGHVAYCRARWTLRLLGWTEHQPRN